MLRDEKCETKAIQKLVIDVLACSYTRVHTATVVVGTCTSRTGTSMYSKRLGPFLVCVRQNTPNAFYGRTTVVVVVQQWWELSSDRVIV